MSGTPNTKPEIIINQWVFVQQYKHPSGIFPLIYQLGLRLYMAVGNDNDKLALLTSLAPWDYHLASIFPVPKSRTVHLGLGTPDEVRVPTLAGVVPIQSITSPDKQMGLFADALEAVRRLLPEHPLTLEFKHTPLDDLSLLYCFTQVDVGEDGTMTAHTRIPELTQGSPHVAVNLWAFPDSDTHLIRTLGSRAYLAAGDSKFVEAILANLSIGDYLLGSRIALPSSSQTTGSSGRHPMDLAEVMAHPDTMFSLVDDQVENEIPIKYSDCEQKRAHRYTLPPERRIRRISVVEVDSATGAGTR